MISPPMTKVVVTGDTLHVISHGLILSLTFHPRARRLFYIVLWQTGAFI